MTKFQDVHPVYVDREKCCHCREKCEEGVRGRTPLETSLGVLVGNPAGAGQAQAGIGPKLGGSICPRVRSAELVDAPCVAGLHMNGVRHPQPRLGSETLVLLRAARLPDDLPKTYQGAQLIASCEHLCTFTSCRRSWPSVSSSLQAEEQSRCPSCPLTQNPASS